MLVETMEVKGAALSSPIYMCNRSDAPLIATTEEGATHEWQPVAFQIDKPAMRNSTEFMLTARVDAMDGALYRAFAQMTNDDLLHSVFVALRVFVDPLMLDRPVWRQPIRMRCEEVKVALDVVDLTLVGGRLPNKRAGTYFDLSRFVGVRPF
jgi:hypothetical protein